MIVFKTIKWKNFLSTGNFFTEVELNKGSTTLIVGENGAGKSTILDALSFSLFGKPFRKINKPQLLNTINNKNLLVEVEFDIGSIEYKIIRGMKPNVFEVYQNGKLLNQSAEMKDYQSILEKQILKVNHKSFSQVVVLGSATFQPFMQLTTGQRREIIEDLLDLQIFTTMNFILKDKLLVVNEHISESNSQRRILESKIEIMKEHLIEIQSNNEKLIEEKKTLIEETQDKITALIDQCIEVKEANDILKESISEESSISKKLNKLNNLKHQIEANLGIISKEVSFFHDYDNCPTCKQQIDQEFKKQTVEEKNKKIIEIEDGLKLLTEEYDKTNEKLKEIMEINSKISDNNLEINSLKTRISSLVEYKETLENEIQKLNTNTIENDTNKIPEVEKELKAIEKQYYDLVEERSTLQAAATLLKDGGIKSKIIKQYIPIMNKLINKYLSSMEFMCQFELDEQFNETIKSRYRDVFSYASFSEGEKMRINLAILFAWRSIAKMRNSVNTNILIMDEVFDSSLDANGTEEFMKILNSLTSDTNTFIISHKTDQIIDKFDRVIRFEKYKSFSRIAA
jgi:DNA repair exonuclease SbcCD ATPase subunit